MSQTIVVAGAALLLGVLAERPAAADVDIGSSHGWTLSTDGRLNAFLSVARGAAIPKNEQNFTGLDDEATPDGHIESTRLRTGFIMSVLGVSLTKTLAEGVTAKGNVAPWMLAASQRSWGDEPAVSARETWVHNIAGGGRVFYSAFGHDVAAFREPAFMKMMITGIKWAAHRIN